LARSGTVAGSLSQLANMLTIRELQKLSVVPELTYRPLKKTGLPFRITSS
jgi:hypothetical protein